MIFQAAGVTINVLQFYHHWLRTWLARNQEEVKGRGIGDSDAGVTLTNGAGLRMSIRAGSPIMGYLHNAYVHSPSSPTIMNDHTPWPT